MRDKEIQEEKEQDAQIGFKIWLEKKENLRAKKIEDEKRRKLMKKRRLQREVNNQ